MSRWTAEEYRKYRRAWYWCHNTARAMPGVVVTADLGARRISYLAANDGEVRQVTPVPAPKGWTPRNGGAKCQ